MERLLGESIKQEAQILKELKDETIEDISIINDEMIQITGRRTIPNSIIIPVEGLLREKEISLEDAHQLTKKELKQYAFNVLCREVIGEIATIEEATRINGETDLFAYFEPGQLLSILGIKTTEIPRYGPLSDVINVMAEKFDIFPHTESETTESAETDSKTNDFLYAACVTKMRFEQEGREGNSNAQALLNAIYTFDYGNLSEKGSEVVTSQGQARDIAHGLKGYGRASGYDNSLTYPIEFAQARIEGINIINALYSKMVELEYFEPYTEPRKTQDIYELVYANIDKYLEKIIEEAKEIHDDLTPREIGGITRKGFGKKGYVNPQVSLAISNHYLDDIFMQYGIGTDEQERKLAVSQRIRRLSGIDGIGNVELYEENLRKLQSKMITGLTLSKEGNIEIDGEMYATTDIGKVRENQEDAVLLLKDGDVPGLKMMIVADGMGGADKGEVASHRIVNQIREWFEGLSVEEKEHYYSNIADIEQELNKIIREVANELDRRLFKRGGATIVCSIIGRDETIITNVGDSRAYIVNDGRLEQVSVDDAYVQEEYEKGEIPSRDAMRFHHKAYVITSSVGGRRLKKIHSSILSNDDYDMILLFSDGVTDCLSEEEIAVITRTTDKSKLSQELVRHALENLSIAPEEVANMWGYDSEIEGGKDNSTAAVYVKDEKDRDKDEGER